MSTRVAPPIRPLLKWAGGKRQLLPALRQYYPDRFSRYIEPFLGSGAVFFDLLNAGRLEGARSRLVDVNPDLIGCYLTVREQPEAVIGALELLALEHAARGTACYYAVRSQFNALRADVAGGRRAPDVVGCYTPELAAMLIYLNRTGFNGLFRQNRRGEYNVPAGRYAEPRICDPDHVRAVAAAWQRPGLTFEIGSFDETLAQAGEGDFVYCDPPYAPLSRTARFAHYTADGFTPDDHARLRRAVVAAARRGAWVLVSNSSAADIEASYGGPEARNAGLAVRRVPARRAINSRAALRGPVDELIITNATAALSARRSSPMLSVRTLRRRQSA